MSVYHKSIRWRLQIWHTFILILVVSAFGISAWLFLRDQVFREIDEELQRTSDLLVTGVRPNRSGGESRMIFRPPDSIEGDLFGRDLPLFYYVVWIDGEPVGSYPPEKGTIREFPETKSYQYVNSRENQRELIRISNNHPNRSFGKLRPPKVGKSGELKDSTPRVVLLVGCSTENAQNELRRLALLLAGSGGFFILIAVSTGWLLSKHAIRPIETISNTATEISEGDLAKRIDLSDTESELGQLATLLNNSFDRLQDARTRQAQFTADASHELRTPAFVILAEAQSALRRDRTSEEYREQFQICEHAAQHMKELIESLLLLARQDSEETKTNIEECRLDQITESVLEMTSPLAKSKQITIVRKLSPATMAGDEGQLRQVVTNLVSNAIEYTDSGGEISIEVATKSDKAVLTIADNGIGISPEDLPFVFDRFFRADSSRSSEKQHTGLGLAICDALVAAHHGKISVTSNPGEGSRFVVQFPAAEA